MGTFSLLSLALLCPEIQLLSYLKTIQNILIAFLAVSQVSDRCPLLLVFCLFYKYDSRISKMTKYDKFIIHFHLEKMAKTVNLCNKYAKGPFECLDLHSNGYMSLKMRKATVCICNREADKRLCFRYIDSTRGYQKVRALMP